MPETQCRQQWALSATLVLASLLTMPRSAAEALGDVLSGYGLPATGLPAAHAPDDLITSFATLDHQDFFAIAFYEDDSIGILEPPLHVLRYDTDSGWLGTTITELDSGASNQHTPRDAFAV